MTSDFNFGITAIRSVSHLSSADFILCRLEVRSTEDGTQQGRRIVVPYQQHEILYHNIDAMCEVRMTTCYQRYRFRHDKDYIMWFARLQDLAHRMTNLVC